jgi:hypothetical protein
LKKTYFLPYWYPLVQLSAMHSLLPYACYLKSVRNAIRIWKGSLEVNFDERAIAKVCCEWWVWLLYSTSSRAVGRKKIQTVQLELRAVIWGVGMSKNGGNLLLNTSRGEVTQALWSLNDGMHAFLLCVRYPSHTETPNWYSHTDPHKRKQRKYINGEILKNFSFYNAGTPLLELSAMCSLLQYPCDLKLVHTAIRDAVYNCLTNDYFIKKYPFLIYVSSNRKTLDYSTIYI